MKDLTKEDLKKIIDCGNVIEIYDKWLGYTFTFYYEYSGDDREAVFLNNKFYGYFDLDVYVDKIKLLKEEMEDNYYHLIEELDFIDSNILKDIIGEKYEREN